MYKSAHSTIAGGRTAPGAILMATFLLGISIPMLGGNAQAQQGGRRIAAANTSIKVLYKRVLGADTTGRLIEVAPDMEGQPVKAGDVIFRLDDTEVRERLATQRFRGESDVQIEYATASFDKAEIDLKVAEDAGRVFSPIEIREKRMEVKRSELQIEKAREDKILAEKEANEIEAALKKYTVHAPISGVVSMVHKRAGETVTPGDPVIEITDLSQMRAILQLPLEAVTQVNVGDPVVIFARFESAKRSSPGGDRGSLPFPPRSESEITPRQPSASASPKKDVLEQSYTGVVTYVESDLAGANQYLQVQATIDNTPDSQGRHLLREAMEVRGSVIVPDGDN